MSRTAEQLRHDAMSIWRAGLDAVRSETLMRENMRVDGPTLWIQDEPIDLRAIRRIAVVGAGKAGAGMAAAVEELLGESLADEKDLAGWVNVPADCIRPLSKIHLHAARPAGLNEPTEQGVAGTAEIIRLVESLGPDDLCICLISGGGSALMLAPIEGITLANKQAVTRHLSAAGANIQQLNTVRKQLSRIKGGRLATACRAGRLATLIISDVIGDPLDVIASGPTVSDSSTPREAIKVLEQFGAREAGISPAVFDALERATPNVLPIGDHVQNVVIGNNAVAVDAAGMEAERLGYSHAMTAAAKLEGAAELVGQHHAQMAVRMRQQAGPDCLITGGEPTVELVDSAVRGLGGRNQQLVLAALAELGGEELAGVCLLAGGTDGEDGPTDAAGALVDSAIFQAATIAGFDPADYLGRNDAYRFFDPLGGLIKTGPTHTNVCDLRVVVVDRVETR